MPDAATICAPCSLPPQCHGHTDIMLRSRAAAKGFADLLRKAPPMLSQALDHAQHISVRLILHKTLHELLSVSNIECIVASCSHPFFEYMPQIQALLHAQYLVWRLLISIRTAPTMRLQWLGICQGDICWQACPRAEQAMQRILPDKLLAAQFSRRK